VFENVIDNIIFTDRFVFVIDAHGQRIYPGTMKRYRHITQGVLFLWVANSLPNIRV
jgi:hypothetical protein